MVEGETSKAAQGHNYHACAIEIAGIGLLVEGRSGSGKTSLCHGLIDHYIKLGVPAIWVSDDQVLLDVRNGDFVANAPAPIAGKAELYGLGIVDVPYKDATWIALVVRLMDDRAIERMPELCQADFSLCGGKVSLPLIEVPERHENQSIRLVSTVLSRMYSIGTGNKGNNQSGNSPGLGLHPGKNP